MQFSKLFGVTLLAMASFGHAQLNPPPPVPPPPSITRTYSGYFPRRSPQSDFYWVQDQVQGAFETIMVSESCPDVGSAKIEWFAGAGSSIPTYLQSIPTQPLPPSKEWKEYINYYGSDTFHIDWVDAAFNCDSTAGFGGDSLPFDPDFSTAYCGGTSSFPAPSFAPGEVAALKECVGIEESVKKATSYVYNFIETVQLMEKAIKEAKSGNCNLQRDELGSIPPCTDVVEYWDAAAATFTGSFEGEIGGLPGGVGSDPRTYGKTLYTLGEKRCRNFKTCGPNGDLGAPDRYNTASINTKIMQFFGAGSQASYIGDYRRMEYFKRQISAKIMVPWTQGVFRYAHRLSTSGAESNQHKEIAEGSTFALGALPKLWACSIKAAETVAPFLKTGRTFGPGDGIDFIVLKKAFECNYRCLGITCEEVGALYDVDLVYDSNDDLVSVPKPDAEACDDKDNLSGAKEVAKCTKPNSKYNKKCKKYVGKSGISGRTNFEYFTTNL